MGDIPRLSLRERARAFLALPDERPPSDFDALEPASIVGTADRLSRRISERFPDSGLVQVAEHLCDVARDARRTARWIGRPLVGLRVVSTGLAIVILLGLTASFVAVGASLGKVKLVELVAGLEAGINDVVLIGAGIFFLVTLETRIKRNRALAALHKLRSLAHIIDMHQLTKSPDRLASDHTPTESSPEHVLTAYELGRYLDYCSEMLSLTGKIAALYIQHFDDGVALSAVNEIEALTTGLSRKIWQKMVSLQAFESEQTQ